MLSLELILHILQSSGPAFRTGEKFIYAVRNYLCVSLLGNCTSQVTQVVGLSLQIFLALMDDFKDRAEAPLGFWQRLKPRLEAGLTLEPHSGSRERTLFVPTQALDVGNNDRGNTANPNIIYNRMKDF